jgi:2-dehydropantoate 2-reductase
LRQVPANSDKYSYLIVGNGRLSKHFQHYFQLKNISFKVWTRNTSESHQTFEKNAESILVLINDDAIQNFLENNSGTFSKSKNLIHCSGMLSTPLAESAHPLMTFADELYSLEKYESVNFITEKGRKSFNELFPELNNLSYAIESSEKTLYHAYCVLSGNFTTLMWKFFFNYLKSNNIPDSAAFPHLIATKENLMKASQPLSGPLIRNDSNTIFRHLQVLEDHPLRNLYISFLEAYDHMKNEKQYEDNK